MTQGQKVIFPLSIDKETREMIFPDDPSLFPELYIDFLNNVIATYMGDLPIPLFCGYSSSKKEKNI